MLRGPAGRSTDWNLSSSHLGSRTCGHCRQEERKCLLQVLQLPYDLVMHWTLRELAVFAAAADQGSFSEAAAELHVSQAAVSRTIGGLEKSIGGKLLRRVPRGCELTPTGQQILPQARRVLAEAQRFTDFVVSRRSVLRLGYAWAAVGRHTTQLQRQWAVSHPALELKLIRHNSPTGGLAEGLCDVAIVRIPLEDPRLESVIVGLERRFVAFATDDPQWSRRRQLSMSEIAERTVLIDPRAGTTTSGLWAGTERHPTFIESSEVDGWLDAVAAGGAVGTTAEATVHHHPRPGVTYRP
ncbi:LysR family transcriptional regulator, partial [Mycolicibacterium sp.]